MKLIVEILHDEEADVWIAKNEDIGLVLESDSRIRLVERVREAVPELLQLNSIPGTPEIVFEERTEKDWDS